LLDVPGVLKVALPNREVRNCAYFQFQVFMATVANTVFTLASFIRFLVVGVFTQFAYWL
jgi:hypothetical protein